MALFKHAPEELAQEYQIFLDYLSVNQVQLSKPTERIGKKDCFALNGLFHIVSERYQSCGRTQEYYIVIDFFYFFSVRAGILQVEKKKGKTFAVQMDQRYQMFSQMSALERYILMMSVWFGEYQDALADSFSIFRGNLVFESLREARPGTALSTHFKRITAPWESHYVPEARLYALFQLIRIQWMEEDEEDKDNKFRIKELYQTKEGDFLNKLFQKQKRVFWYNLSIDTMIPVLSKIANIGSAKLNDKLMCFWVKPEEEGLHTIELKIEIESCVRKIKIGDQFTLDELHYLIQESVDFDMDHLYYFEIGSGTLKRRYFAPECEDESWTTDTVVLAELSLYEGMQFKYLFDFGDEWHFKITVERILPQHTEENEISKIKGEPPEQ